LISIGLHIEPIRNLHTNTHTQSREYFQHVHEAASFLRERLGTADIALVLGSGLSNFTDELADPKVQSIDPPRRFRAEILKLLSSMM